jgi:hypothetical protein
MENINGLLEAISQQRIAVADAKRIATAAQDFLHKETDRLSELEAQSNGAFCGRNRYTDTQRVDCRRRIRSVLDRPRCISEICEAMSDLDRGLIEQEIDYLCNRVALVWNGCRGPASKYSRK